jgi:restriction endonuclease S subunit
LDFSLFYCKFVEIILRNKLKTSLKNIATITTGIYTTPDADGNTFYLQAKHFNNKGVIEILPKPEIWLNEKHGKHLLKTGDILFAAKGTKNFAVVFDNEIGNAVASSTFLILRINNQYSDKILPEYLAWWLNNSVNQKLLKNSAIGSALPSISKAVFQELEIYIPDLNRQKLILKIVELKDKESEYLQKIDKLRKLLVQNKILNTLS